MINQYLKNTYYLSVGKLSLISFFWNKLKSHLGYFENSIVNIGCGKHYIDWMVNIDGNIFQKKDIWLDCTIGLPFLNNSIKAIYCSQFLEHFNSVNARKILSEFYRILKPGGCVRIIVPSLEYAVRGYIEKKRSCFPDWPEEFESIGGRFNNFLLCSNQHFLMFDYSFLEELLQEASFTAIFNREEGHSRMLKVNKCT